MRVLVEVALAGPAMGLSVVAPHLALAETQHAFDGVASGYDALNEANPVIRWMRAQTMAAVRAAAPPGSRVLDLGCGPGRDAVGLAAAGRVVTAIDWSAEMVRCTERRAAASGLRLPVTARALGIHEVARLEPASFDAAYSDLGPFNCVPDLDAAAAGIARALRPGGTLVASVIGRYCPWEVALYTARGQWTRAAIRFQRGLVRVPLDGRGVWTRYFRPSEFDASFARAGFTRVSLAGLGVALPPPYLDGWARRHPRAIRALARVDEVVGRWPLVRHLGDHFLIVLRRSA